MKKLMSSIGLTAIATLTFAGSANFKWDANTESDLAGYRLRWSNTYGGAPVGVVDVGLTNAVSLSSTNFQFMKTNFFSVTAYNTSGFESQPSTNYVWWVRTNNTPPSMVLNFNLISATP